MSAESREHLRRRQDSDRRDLLVLVHRHLLEEGLGETASAMRSELPWVDLEGAQVCDNVDLSLVLMEFQNFYQVLCGVKALLYSKKKASRLFLFFFLCWMLDCWYFLFRPSNGSSNINIDRQRENNGSMMLFLSSAKTSPSICTLISISLLRGHESVLRSQRKSLFLLIFHHTTSISMLTFVWQAKIYPPLPSKILNLDGFIQLALTAFQEIL